MGYSPLITSQQSKVGSNGKSSNPCLQSTDRESRGLTTAEGVIIERVAAGTPARWASNYENALTPLDAGAMAVVVPHITHGGGGGWNNGIMDGSPIFRWSAAGLSATGSTEDYR